VKLEENGAATIFKDGWVYLVEGSVMPPKIHRPTQGGKWPRAEAWPRATTSRQRHLQHQ